MIATAESLLAIDVGTINTRVALFDIVEGSYRFIAAGSAQTTAFAPYRDVSEGFSRAIDNLQELTGRRFLGPDAQLIVPAQPDGSGVDKCICTLSAGGPLKVVAVGLLEDVSLQSVQNLVSTTYAQVVGAISLNDQRVTSQRLDSIIRLQPDLIVIGGGTDGGASKSIAGLLESVGLACYLTPKEQRPEILFVGNQSLLESVSTQFNGLASFQSAPNIRPALEGEQLLPAQRVLSDTYRKARMRSLGGVQMLSEQSGGFLMPTAAAFGRTIRFIGKELEQKHRGVLGVDLGAGAATLAASFGGDLYLDVLATLGLGIGMPNLLKHTTLGEIWQWVDEDVSQVALQDYIYNKMLYPASLPATVEELSLEYALACEMLRLVVRKARWTPPDRLVGAIPGFLPPFESIIASGSIFSHAPSNGRLLLTLLNALQPVGWSTLVLDQNQIAPMLGAAAESVPLLTLQALRDASNFVSLGMVFAPVGTARPGTPVMRVQVKYADGSETENEIKYGTIEAIHLPPGQTATVRLQPLHRFDIGMGVPGRGGTMKNVPGSEMGLVIDARGRALELPEDGAARREQLKQWLSALNG